MSNLDDLEKLECRLAHQFHLRGTAVMTFVIYWLMVLSYQDFFFFDPSDSSGIFRQATLWFYLFGWISAGVGTPVLLFLASSGSLRALSWIPVTVLGWPVAIVLAQVSAYAQTGESYLGYLFDYPIFLLSDVALPAFLMLKWSRMREVLVLSSVR